MRIAVVGTGISGMTAAYLLCPDHEIVVYEADDYIGGHTHTIDVTAEGRNWAVDTGFIVFNLKTYPNFVRLMQRLGVAWQPSNMSFSVQCGRTGLVFSPSSLNSLFIQRRNLFNPTFYRMLLDAIVFRRRSRELLSGRHGAMTLGQYLDKNGYGRAFRDQFIIPMGEAIWSADPKAFEDFPARYFVEFFSNHGFLNIRDQPQWLTISGGSRQYIGPLTQRYKDKIRLNSQVQAVKRANGHVTVTPSDGQTEKFDHVVIAAHSDQALRMLADPTEREREILGAIAYQPNLAVLHTDPSMLPPYRAAWAAWNYHIPKDPLGRVALTYNMNILQNLSARRQFCVTLNRPDAIAPDKELGRMTYHHPIYTPPSLAARERWCEISGTDRIHYCGAYWFYGFHEDGVKSALAVAKYFGKTL
jgi:predicted NAD/FAD-binding protein